MACVQTVWYETTCAILLSTTTMMCVVLFYVAYKLSKSYLFVLSPALEWNSGFKFLILLTEFHGKEQQFAIQPDFTAVVSINPKLIYLYFQ